MGEIKMENQKNEKGNIILRNDIYCGVLSHIKVVHVDDKIKGAEVLDRAFTKKIIALNVRKIAFAKKDICRGQDLFYRLDRNTPYEYGVVSLNYKLECDTALNNLLVIRNPQHMNAVLEYAGYGMELDRCELKMIKEILMSKDDRLSIEAHDVRLGSNGIFALDENKVVAINAQAAALREFRTAALPVRPQIKEKVYAKYFK
jgi:hypothetical protein